jgi:hypothetical protein
MRQAILQRDSERGLGPGAIVGGFSESSSGEEEVGRVQVALVGEASFLSRYRLKMLGKVSKAAVFEGVSKDLARELVFSATLTSNDPVVVEAHCSSLLAYLPVMLKKAALTPAQSAAPVDCFIKAMEVFLAKHRGWKSLVQDEVRSRSKKDTAKRRRKQVSGSDSDTPVKKAPALQAFARPVKSVESISLKVVAKGEELTNIFRRWRDSADKILPYQALKFIGKQVASPNSEFLHPTRGVYNVLHSDAQVELRDAKLRNIFEDVVYELIPGRVQRKNEYEAAEALRDKGGKLAKAARLRREKRESVLLSRLAVECELVLMGAKSWSAFASSIRGDGVAEAIQASFRHASDDSSDEDPISIKVAAAAWRKAMAAKVTATPNRPLRVKKRADNKKQASNGNQLAASVKSGFASLRSSLANAGWGGGQQLGGGTQTKPPYAKKMKCWQCNEVGHAWFETDRCKLAGKPPAPGSRHAKKAARGAVGEP